MSGLGSSFLMEMNVKKVLAKLGLNDVEVEHSTISDVMPGSTDLIVCSADIAEECASAGGVIPLVNLLSGDELEQKLRKYLEERQK
jgi:PTS system ascorbate-specific IIB component